MAEASKLLVLLWELVFLWYRTPGGCDSQFDRGEARVSELVSFGIEHEQLHGLVRVTQLTSEDGVVGLEKYIRKMVGPERGLAS